MPEERLPVLEVLRRTEEYFRRAGIESARLDAEVLLAHVLGGSRIQLYTGYDRPLLPDELSRYRLLVRRRAGREPVAYLTGTREFHSLDFKVDPTVLIPRPETEHLVERAIEVAAALAAPRLLDLGTGSGAIAVSFAVNVPAGRIVATDISAEALEVARGNADRHAVLNRIQFALGDMYAPVRDQEPFDIVAVNPPYVGEEEEVDPECRAEPRGAIFTDGDPIDHYARVLAGAATVLRPGGVLLMELPGAREREIAAVMPAALALVAVHRDYQSLPRVLEARLA